MWICELSSFIVNLGMNWNAAKAKLNQTTFYVCGYSSIAEQYILMQFSYLIWNWIRSTYDWVCCDSHKCMVYYVKNQCETGIGHWHSNRNDFKRLQTLARTYNELNLNEPQSIEPATSNAVVVVHLHFICIWNSRQRSVIFLLFKRYFVFFFYKYFDRQTQKDDELNMYNVKSRQSEKKNERQIGKFNITECIIKQRVKRFLRMLIFSSKTELFKFPHWKVFFVVVWFVVRKSSNGIFLVYA